MSGLLVPETCCPAVAEGAETPRQPALQQPGCCERITVTNDRVPAVSGDRVDELPSGPVAVVTARAPAPLVAAAQRPRPDSVLRPPGRSAPAFLLTHAFLI